MENIIGIFSESFWYIAPMLMAVTVAFSGFINRVCKVKKAWVKQLISWVVGAGTSVGAWALELITFGDPVWMGITALAFVIGLSSNGIYDIPTIKNWIDSWFSNKK